ncbi:MAG: DUF2142 domain-containing protein [Patescibacteria group bacterium]|jgi:hypothetical protein
MKNKVDAIFLILMCGIFLIVANIYNFKTEKFSAPDEFSHFEYIRFLNNNHHFPALTNKTSFWEAHQPPLYYLFLSPIDLVLKNKILIDSEIKILRFFSSLLGVLTVIFAFLTAKLLFNPPSSCLRFGYGRQACGTTADKERIIYYSLTLAFCFWPMFLFISGVLNNDVLANLLGVMMLYFVVKHNTNIRIYANDTNMRIGELRFFNLDLFVCGVIAGLAFLTKLTLYPFAMLFLIIIFWKNRNNWKDYLKFTLSPALIVCFAWMFRNLIFVGDIFGLKFANKFWEGQHRDLWNFNNFVTWLNELFKNFLGVFGQANIGFDPKYYDYFLYFLILVAILLPVSLFLIWKKQKDKFNIVLIIFLFFIVAFLTTFYYSLDNYQPQGRYLLPALFSAMLMFVLAINIIFAGKLKFIMPVLILIILAFLNKNAFLHIDWTNEHKPLISNDEKYNLISKKWIAKNSKWKNKNKNYVLKINKKDAFLRSDPNLRLDTNVVKCLKLKLKNTEFKKLKVEFRYLGDKDFLSSNSVIKKIHKDGKFHAYEFDFDLRKNDLVQIIRLDFVGSKKGSVEFKKIMIE